MGADTRNKIPAIAANATTTLAIFRKILIPYLHADGLKNPAIFCKISASISLLFGNILPNSPLFLWEITTWVILYILLNYAVSFTKSQ
jgi:hypothetical protein